jgi:hypothetical protein
MIFRAKNCVRPVARFAKRVFLLSGSEETGVSPPRTWGRQFLKALPFL